MHQQCKILDMMPPGENLLEYHLEPIIKQFNTPTLRISVRIHEICLGICPKILSSLCTATANTSFLFPRSLMQVKVSPGFACKCKFIHNGTC